MRSTRFLLFGRHSSKAMRMRHQSERHRATSFETPPSKSSVSLAVIAVVLVVSTGNLSSAAVIPGGESATAASDARSAGMPVELDELLAPNAAENGTVHRVVVQIGETVLLPCKAYSLGQRTVSWIRRRDWHIMSSGTTVYTADSRFSVINRPGSPDWILMLKSPQLHDSGTYECQIVGGQGQVSQYVELLVWSPVAVVSEGGEHHVEAESNVQLHCQLRPEAPLQPASGNASRDRAAAHHVAVPAVSGAPFAWYHNGRPLKDGLKSASGLGTVSIRLLDGEGAAERAGAWWSSVTSRLEILRADHADSGNYTCAPWRGAAASVSVFVSQGDRPAAVQRQAALRSSIPLNVLIFGLNFVLLQVR